MMFDIFLGELIGTFILIIFGSGVVAGSVLKDSKAFNGGWVVIIMGWGIAVTLAIYASGQLSGAHINPAVSISLWIKKELSAELLPYYLSGQFLGAFLGAIFVWIHYLPHWKKTKDSGAILAVFATAPAVKNTPSNLMSEILGTFILLLALSAIGTNSFADGLNPLTIGVLIVAIGASMGGTTGYAINPARDFAPRLAHFLLPIANKGKSDWHYAWIPVIGPIIGGIWGMLTYELLFDKYLDPLFIPTTIVVFAITLWALNKRN